MKNAVITVFEKDIYNLRFYFLRNIFIFLMYIISIISTKPVENFQNLHV